MPPEALMVTVPPRESSELAVMSLSSFGMATRLVVLMEMFPPGLLLPFALVVISLSRSNTTRGEFRLISPPLPEVFTLILALLSRRIESALRSRVPAFPEPLLLKYICPPSRTVNCPVVTVTFPAEAVVDVPEVKPLGERRPMPLTSTDCVATTCKSPADSSVNVAVDIPAPSRMINRLVLILRLPAPPLAPAPELGGGLP